MKVFPFWMNCAKQKERDPGISYESDWIWLGLDGLGWATYLLGAGEEKESRSVRTTGAHIQVPATDLLQGFKQSASCRSLGSLTCEKKTRLLSMHHQDTGQMGH